MKFCYKNIVGLLLLLFSATALFAQDVEEEVQQASIYLTERTDKLVVCLNKTQNLQQHLLKRLQRKEAKMLRQLAKQDSALYKQYIQQHPLSYDSIAAIANDTARRHETISNFHYNISSFMWI